MARLYSNENFPFPVVESLRLLGETVSEDGGPLIHNGDSEEQQRAFDSTCRRRKDGELGRGQLVSSGSISGVCA